MTDLVVKLRDLFQLSDIHNDDSEWVEKFLEENTLESHTYSVEEEKQLLWMWRKYERLNGAE